MRRFVHWLLYLVLCASVLECASPDKKDWVDPGDMLRYNSATKTMKSQQKVESTHEYPPVVSGNDDTSAERSQSSPSLAVDTKIERSTANDLSTVATVNDLCSCDKCDMKFTKRFVQRLLRHFSYEKTEVGDELTFDVKMRLNKLDLVVLETFTSKEARSSINEVDDILSRLIHGVKLRNSNYFEDHGSTNGWKIVTDNIVIFIIAGAVLLFTIIWSRLRTTKGYLVLSCIIVVLVSVGYEWMHLYQKLEAEKLAERSQFQNVPDECDPSRMSFFAKFNSIFSNTDLCKNYYQNIMVDSFYEINPMLAMTSMVGRMMDTFFGSLGTSMSKLFSNSISQLSFFHGLLMFVVLTVLIYGFFHSVVKCWLWRPRTQPVYQDNLPMTAAIDNMHQERLVPIEHIRTTTSLASRRAAQSSSVNPGYYCIRNAPNAAVEEVYFVSGDVLQTQCTCRQRSGESGVHILADRVSSGDDQHQIAPPVDSSDVAASSDQAEKIALIVSMLADELEKKAKIGRTESEAVATSRTGEGRPTDGAKRDAREAAQSSESSRTEEASTCDLKFEVDQAKSATTDMKIEFHREPREE